MKYSNKYSLKVLATLLIGFISLATNQSFAQSSLSSQTIKGRIIEQVTQQPIVGANVFILGTILGSATNADGYYKISNVPLGMQTIRVSFIGYETQTNTNVKVTAGKEVIANFQLVETTLTLDEVSVVYSRDKDFKVTNNAITNVSARSFNVDETKLYAGSLGDPSRMVANFAGVVANNDSRNDIVVRGNSPLGVLWQLEGINIPNPNHYGSTYSTGGVVSMLNNNLLSKSDFFTSAFPSQYGNAVAGVFDLRLREGNNEKHEFLGQFGFNGFELGTEGPLSKESEASYLINYRYTALGLMKNLGVEIGTDSPPYYQDLNMKFTFPMKNSSKLTFFALGGTSRIDLLGKDVDTSKTNYYGRIDQNLYPKFTTGIAGASFETALSSKTFAKFTVGVSSAEQLYREDSIAVDQPGKPTFLITDATFNITKYSAAANLTHKFSAKSSFYFGMNTDYSVTDIFRKKIYLDGERIWADFKDDLILSQGYINWKYRIGDRTIVNAGLHVQHLNINNQAAIEPRIGLSYQLTDKSSVNFGYGLHQQSQGSYTYFVQNLAGQRSNMNLKFSRSNHFVLGYNQYLGDIAVIKIEMYYQYLDKIPVHQYPSSFNIVNEGANLAPVDQSDLVSNGTGRNYGIDFTVERYLNDGFYFLITGSLYNSKYKGSDGIERNTTFNSNYVLNLLGGKEWKLNKRGDILALNLKFTTTGGRYFTPLNLAASQAAGDAIEDTQRAF
ncbi:MAG: TonB-dependent receptor, partial [Bacteroidetes bacterium]|nr:TonB-dependent receptor [Bacteroidota bacterium]